MGLPRPSFLRSVPDALHVTAYDAANVAHDGVMVSVAFANDLTDYGITRRDEGDSVYVAAPFAAPENKIAIEKDGVRTVRRIDGRSANPLFVRIDLGEEA